MTIKTTPLSALFYSLSIFGSVWVASANYFTVEQDKLGRDLILAQYQQETDLAIAKLAQGTMISEDETRVSGYEAIAEVWGCR